MGRMKCRKRCVSLAVRWETLNLKRCCIGEGLEQAALPGKSRSPNQDFHYFWYSLWHAAAVALILFLCSWALLLTLSAWWKTAVAPLQEKHDLHTHLLPPSLTSSWWEWRDLEGKTAISLTLASERPGHPAVICTLLWRHGHRRRYFAKTQCCPSLIFHLSRFAKRYFQKINKNQMINKHKCGEIMTMSWIKSYLNQ